jgi:hypothetical protein
MDNSFIAGTHYAGRVCPITRRKLQIGDEIVVCATCDTVYTAEGWRYIGGECPICGLTEALLMPDRSQPVPSTEVIAPTSSSGAWLYLIEGHEGQRRYQLNDHSEKRIGRAPDNDIILDDKFVSRHHALVKGDRGVFYLHDLASRNGTMLNGYPIQRSILYDGDVLSFGDHISLVFKNANHEQPPT